MCVVKENLQQSWTGSTTDSADRFLNGFDQGEESRVLVREEMEGEELFLSRPSVTHAVRQLALANHFFFV